MMVQPQSQLSWKDRRNQRRKKKLFGSAVVIVILAVIVTIVLTLIAIVSPIVGVAIISGVAAFIAFITWFDQRRSLSTSGNMPSSMSATSSSIGISASVPLVPPILSSNPFNALGRLLDRKDFYGRESERNTLIERTRLKLSTSIVGPRRMGKTWLLQYLMLVAADDLGSTYHIVEMSMQSATFNTLVGFVDYVLKELKRAQHNTEVCKILEEALIALEKEQVKSEPNILAVWEKAIRDLSREAITLVLCIDEFNNVANSPQRKRQFNLDFFRSLRALADSQTTNLVLVIASQDPLRKIVGRVGHESGFFNIFSQINVRPFRLSEAESFVQTKGDQAQFTDLERDYLLKFGGRGRWMWCKYWPIQLEAAGRTIYSDRALGPNHYRPDEKAYWNDLKKRLAETSVF